MSRVKSFQFHSSYSFEIDKLLIPEDEEAKKKKKKKKRSKKKEIWPTMQQVQSANSSYGRAPSSSQTSPTPSVHAPSTIDVSASFSRSAISAVQLAPATAQSARAYIASEGLDVEPKGKIKTRADPFASAEQRPKEKKRGFFSQFTRKNKETDEERKEEDREKKGAGMFRSGLRPKLHLPPKAASLIGRVLGGRADEKKGQAGMKWEHFVKVCFMLWFGHIPATTREADGGHQAMKLLGFREVRGTEGSSVRFDPPSDLDHVRTLLLLFFPD